MITFENVTGLNDVEKIAFKKSLKEFCRSHLAERIQQVIQKINEAMEQSESEEKRSAGDKYETGRAMSHLENEMHGTQLSKLKEDLAHLEQVNVERICEQVEAGAFLFCSRHGVFVAAGLGKIKFQEKDILFISISAPLGRLLQGKKRGDNFLLGGQEEKIESLF